ncbi:hypothetical protein A2U01_0101663, partial [Trifolium medium]|nr:hypothetical protein [Trifolium medium]
GLRVKRVNPQTLARIPSSNGRARIHKNHMARPEALPRAVPGWPRPW